MTPGVAEHSSIILMVKPMFINIQHYSTTQDWLVVLTILKNISQWEGWHPIYEMEKKNVPSHQPEEYHHGRLAFCHPPISMAKHPVAPASHLQSQSDLRGGDVAEVKHHRGGHHLAGDSNGYSTPQTNPKRLEIPTEILVINYVSILFGTKHETNGHLV